MKAKQEYIDALRRLVNEHFEEKQETNLDHYFEDL